MLRKKKEGAPKDERPSIPLQLITKYVSEEWGKFIDIHFFSLDLLCCFPLTFIKLAEGNLTETRFWKNCPPACLAFNLPVPVIVC